MPRRATTHAQQVRRYVSTGESGERDWLDWPGETIFAQARAHHAALIDGLLAEVDRRTRRRRLPPEPVVDFPAFVRARLEPMVRGLLPASVREPALARLVPGVRLVTPQTVGAVLGEIDELRTAWDVANLYLDAVGAKRLDPANWAPLGLASGHECFVSVHYFTLCERFDDFVVHEAAHMLNDFKRRDVGLPHTRRKEWLLGIWFRHRELFA